METEMNEKKKIIKIIGSIVICACLLTNLLFAAHGKPFNWTAPNSYGDVNQNGLVDEIDRNSIHAVLTNAVGITTNEWMDIDGDGNVTANDLYLSMGSEFVKIPSGTHVQGLTSNDAINTTPMCSIIGLAVTPQNTVYLDDYFIGRFEVTTEDYVDMLNKLGTNAQLNFNTHYTTDMFSGETNGFGTVVNGSGSYSMSGELFVWTNKPLLFIEASGITTNASRKFVVAPGVLPFRAVSGISVYGAVQYCAANGLILPTEYQWEKAALCNPTNNNNKSSYAISLDAPLGQGDVPNAAVANFANKYNAATMPVGLFCGAEYSSGKIFSVEYEITTNALGNYVYVPETNIFEAGIITSNSHSYYGCYNMVGNVREITRDLMGPVDTNKTISTMFGSSSYVSLIYESNKVAGVVSNPWNNTIGGGGAHGGDGDAECIRGASAMSSFSLFGPFGTQLRGDCRLSGSSRDSEGVPSSSDGFRVCVEDSSSPVENCRVFSEKPRLTIVQGSAYYLFDIILDNVNPESGNIAAMDLAFETSAGIIPAIYDGTNSLFTSGATKFSTYAGPMATYYAAAKTRSAGVLKNTGTGVVTIATCMIMPPDDAVLENLSIAIEKTKLFDDKGYEVEYEVVPEPCYLLFIIYPLLFINRKFKS
jgi:formylglycine-generating enzyme required for sulfatase activity